MGRNPIVAPLCFWKTHWKWVTWCQNMSYFNIYKVFIPTCHNPFDSEILLKWQSLKIFKVYLLYKACGVPPASCLYDLIIRRPAILIHSDVPGNGRCSVSWQNEFCLSIRNLTWSRRYDTDTLLIPPGESTCLLMYLLLE